MKKVILSILSALLLLVSTAGFFSISAAPNTGGSVPTPVVLAASTTPTTGTWYNQSFQEFFTKVYDTGFSAPNEIFGERYTAAQVQWVIYSLFSFIMTGGNADHAALISCATSGDISVCITKALEKVIPQNIRDILTDKNSQNKSFLATITSNPISGVGYVSGLVQKFHIVPEVYAQQGFGYSQNNFVQNLWRISRNIAYALLVVAVIIMSFMIMFRVKISPQVVITIQSALPKIVLALVLITFSYAIAGFLIDLMYVVIGLLATILTTTWGGSGECGKDVVLQLSCWKWPQMFQELTQADIFWVLILYWLSFMVTALYNLFTVGIIYGILFFILAFLSIIILLWYSIKILILTFKTFFNIIISIATAPFVILAGTIMQGAGFGPWLRNLVSNLLVYPVIGGMIFLANFFLRMAAQNWASNLSLDLGYLFYMHPNPIFSSGNWWDPPLSTGFDIGGGGSMRGILLMGVSWTIISMIPKTAELVKAIMAGKEFGESGIGDLFTVPKAVATGTAESYGRALSSTPVTAPAGSVLNVIAEILKRAR